MADDSLSEEVRSRRKASTSSMKMSDGSSFSAREKTASTWEAVEMSVRWKRDGGIIAKERWERGVKSPTNAYQLLGLAVPLVHEGGRPQVDEAATCAHVKEANSAHSNTRLLLLVEGCQVTLPRAAEQNH